MVGAEGSTRGLYSNRDMGGSVLGWDWSCSV